MTEPRWTYVTPADGPSTKLHLPGCRMMTETEKLGRVRTVEGYWDGRHPTELGDLLCQHCQKRADRLPEIKEKRAKDGRPDLMAPGEADMAEDIDWLIAEVERLRTRT